MASTALPVVSSQATQHDSAAVLWAEALSDEGQAWRELALRWQVAIGAGDPCEAAQRAQLACVRHAGAGLKMLQQLARPALLILRDEAGVAKDAGRMAVLVALDDRHAVLQVGARRFSLPLAELVRVWRGELATLVRTPPGWRTGADADAAARRWVQEALDLALPSAAALPWAQRVAAFQVLQGLPADGQVGPLTLMQLNRSAGVDEPRLLPSLER
jgi:general secretion pathway protein A